MHKTGLQDGYKDPTLWPISQIRPDSQRPQFGEIIRIERSYFGNMFL